MATFTTELRVADVQGPGVLLVCSDLHGNLQDYRRMVELFRAESDATLLFLGDLFHGPAVSKAEWTILYEHLADWYPDESAQVYRELATLMDEFPDRVTSLLGNHDHAHVGGPVVSKFHLDESGAMEATMEPQELPGLRELLGRLPLIATSTCGVSFTHGAPPERHFDRDTLEALSLRGYERVPLYAMYRYDLLGELLWRRGSSLEGTEQFLTTLAAAGFRTCDVGVHGHEVVEEGFERVHPRLLNLSTSFGMRRANKRYLRLELGDRYQSCADFKEGMELLPLYPPGHPVD